MGRPILLKMRNMGKLEEPVTETSHCIILNTN